ncbi:recombinase family protein [Kitasatospora sp. NPDC058046]|uniref:recombinase family protein n=1 Tax=Kitasatospora sp. NPDC058046 TaxID=3346312 RepID=UPI0036DB50B5
MRTAIVYLCSTDQLSGPLMEGWCEQRAAAETVPVSEVITDTDELLPPAERPGWQRVMALVAGGDVVMVVTLDRTMLAVGRKDWDALSAGLAEHAAVLITHRTPVPTVPPTDGTQERPTVPAAPPVVELVEAGAQR